MGLPGYLGIEDADMLIDHKLPGTTGSTVDIYLPAVRLCIMVDGEGHFKQHRDISGRTQEVIDDRFNHEAIAKGYRVFRLHYLDQGIYPLIVKTAVHRCRQNLMKHIDFSKSYGFEVRQLWDLQPLNCSQT